MTRGFEKERPFSDWIAERRRAKGSENQFTPRAEILQKVKAELDGGRVRELLVPVEGGPLFMPLYPASGGRLSFLMIVYLRWRCSEVMETFLAQRSCSAC